MSEELKACPFCGGKAAYQAKNMHGLTTIICKQCGVETPWGKPEELSNTWNRRAQPDNPPQWIAVTERLPEDSGEVIISSQWEGHIFSVEEAGYYDESKGEWYTSIDNNLRSRVTHWMPLPTKPGDKSAELVNDNPTLTLDELKQMNEKRVWTQFYGIGMYGLVAYRSDPDDGDDVYITNNLGGRDTYEAILGQGGAVYARKPEEGEKA
jgi:restriction alleviation protein, Lar family